MDAAIQFCDDFEKIFQIQKTSECQNVQGNLSKIKQWAETDNNRMLLLPNTPLENTTDVQLVVNLIVNYIKISKILNRSCIIDENLTLKFNLYE